MVKRRSHVLQTNDLRFGIRSIPWPGTVAAQRIGRNLTHGVSLAGKALNRIDDALAPMSLSRMIPKEVLSALDLCYVDTDGESSQTPVTNEQHAFSTEGVYV